MNEDELFEQAKARVQRKKGKCLKDKDIIINQEKEIRYYREKIQRMMDKQVDYITETYYIDNKLYKEVTINYK